MRCGICILARHPQNLQTIVQGFFRAQVPPDRHHRRGGASYGGRCALAIAGVLFCCKGGVNREINEQCAHRVAGWKHFRF